MSYTPEKSIEILNWQSGVTYEENAEVMYGDLVFRCVTEHYSGISLIKDAVYWECKTPGAELVLQNAHGFAAGQIICISTSGAYVLAKADSINTVSNPPKMVLMSDVNWFLYISGPITVSIPGHGLSVGVLQYLSSTVAGEFTSVAPIAVGQYQNPILRALDANTIEMVSGGVEAILPSGGGDSGLIGTVFFTENTGSSAQPICFTMFNNKLYVGCNDGNILIYDGSAWSSISCSGNSVAWLFVYNDVLYAGLSNGTITSTTNGTAWNVFTGSDFGIVVTSFSSQAIIFNNSMYVAFVANNGARGILKYDGASWSYFTAGAKDQITSLCVYGALLYVGASLELYTFNGSTFSQLPPETIPTSVLTMLVFQNELYVAAGNYTFYVFNGATWAQRSYPAPNDSAPYINCLMVVESKMYGGLGSGAIVAFDGSDWSYISPTATGAKASIQICASVNGSLFFGVPTSSPAAIISSEPQTMAKISASLNKTLADAQAAVTNIQGIIANLKTTNISDMPASLSGQKKKVLTVKNDETGYELAAASGGSGSGSFVGMTFYREQPLALGDYSTPLVAPAVYNDVLYYANTANKKLVYFDNTIWRENNALSSVLPSGTNFIRCSAVHDGKLYYAIDDDATAFKGVAIYDGTFHFTAATANDYGIVGSMISFNGKLYMGCENGTMKSLVTGDTTVAAGVSTGISGPIRSMVILGSKLYLFQGNSGGIGCFDGTNYTLQNQTEMASDNFLAYSNAVVDGVAYSRTSNGVVAFDGTKVSLIPTSTIDAATPEAVAAGDSLVSNGNIVAIGKLIYFPTLKGGFKVFDGNNWTYAWPAATQQSSMSNVVVYKSSLFTTNSVGQIFSSQQSVLAKKLLRMGAKPAIPTGTMFAYERTITNKGIGKGVAYNGKIYYGCDGGSVLVYNNASAYANPYTIIPPATTGFSVCPAAMFVWGSLLYVGVGSSVFVYNGITWTRLTNTISASIVCGIVFNSAAWFGLSSGGIAVYNGSTWTEYSTSVTLATATMDAGIAVYNSALYMSSNGNLLKYNGSTWSVASAVGYIVNTMIVFNNMLFLGHNTGIIVYNGGVPNQFIFSTDVTGLGNPIRSSIVFNNMVIFGDSQGTVITFDATTWNIFRNATGRNDHPLSCAVALGTDLFFGSYAGKVLYGGSEITSRLTRSQKRTAIWNSLAFGG